MPLRDHNIPNNEFLETLNPGSTKPEADFLNRSIPANDNTQLAEGATYSTQGSLNTTDDTNDNEQTTETIRTTSSAPDVRPNRKIRNVDAGLMLAVAALFDLIGLVPLLGNITSTVGSIVVFGIWFLILGVSLMSPKKVASWGISLVAEAIPGVGSVVPGVTLGVLLVILIDRVEEKTGLNISGLAKGNVTDLATIKKNLGGQIQARFTGATPANDSGETTTNEPRQRFGQTPIHPEVSQPRQMVDNVRKAS